MGIFDKHEQQSISSSETTIISSGTKVEGILRCATRIHIDGEVKGEIDSKSIVTIGKKGKFYGNIIAKKLILNGFIDGSVDCDSVELLMGCVFKGKITSKELMIEAEASFDGQSIMKSSQDVKKRGDIN